MTESICLHIQDRESGPIRVVELPWISVRIGHAAHCEVRLTEFDLPDEVCRLQRRGQSWRLLPVKSESPVLLDGRRLGGSCLLPFDVPFRVGQYCLTLRQDRAAEPDWEIYTGPAPPQTAEAEDRFEDGHSTLNQPLVAHTHPRTPLETNATPKRETKPVTVEEPPIAGEQFVPSQSPIRSSGSRERWDTRWKALGAQVKARAERNRLNPDVKRPAYQPEFEPVPLKEPRVPLIQPVLSPAIQPATATIPPPGATKVEPTWARPKAEPPWRDHTVEKPAAPPTSQQPWRDLVAPGATVQPLQSPLERVDLETEHAPLRPAVPVQSEPVPIPPAESPEIVLPSAASAPLLESAIEPAEPDANTPEIDYPTSSPVDPEPAKVTVTEEALEAPPKKPRSAPDRSTVGPKKREKRATDIVGSPRRTAARRVERSTAGAQPPGEPRALATSREAAGAPIKEVEWPSAKDILATHRAVSRSQVPATNAKKATKKQPGSNAMPTLARSPGQWAAPAWLAGPVAFVFIVAIGLPACVLSWSWARDSYTASIVTDRLLTTDRNAHRSPLPDSVTPPQGGWLVSTPGHLSEWAIYLSRLRGDSGHSPEETTALLERALQASPIHATTRLALAQREPLEPAQPVSLRSLSLSRDAVSLAWSARRLMAVGKKDDALKLYGHALSVALPSESTRAPVPRFSDDPGVPRYLLPGEEQVREIVREIVSSNAWTFPEWSSELPETPIVLLATARLLREQGRGEADALVDLILNQKSSPEASGVAGPVTAAARAEAFALRSRWKEADQLYRQAIESIDDATIQRSWWFNLADISFRMDDEIQRQAALRAASAVAYSDDITRRATDIQRASRARPVTRSSGVKAN